MNQDKQLPLFCENLRCLRAKHRLSKTEMAHILGVGIKSLTSLEHGEASPRLGSSVLYNASVYFNISADNLLHSRIE